MEIHLVIGIFTKNIFNKSESIVMEKLLEIREYDKITCSERYRNSAAYKFLEPEVYQELHDYVEKVTRNQKKEKSPFMLIHWEAGVGEVIEARNFVGLVQLESGIKIQIVPKMELAPEENKSRKVLLNMLKEMKDFSGWNLPEARVISGSTNLYDIFIDMYIREAKTLVKRGIRSDYVEKEGNLTSYKGKLLVARQIRENMVHQERFYVRYQEYSQNRAENRIIKTTLMKLKKATSNGKQTQEIKKLLSAFEEIPVSSDIKNDFAKVRTDRNSKEYEQILKWSRVFLENESFGCFAGEEKARSLLFPMEELYENYVACRLKKHPENTWKVSVQDGGHTLFDTPKMFKIRPDIVLRKDGRCVILDTKWKLLEGSRWNNYGIKSADMYQMYAYSKRYKAQDIWLLYPQTEWMRNQEPVLYDSGENDAGFPTRIHIFGVDVTDINASLARLLEKLEVDAGNGI